MTCTQKMTAKSLGEWFDYDGVSLTWKDKSRETKICYNKAGYPMIRFMGNARLVHRLVYIMVYGFAPKEIDHANGNVKDYRIENLREASRSQQICNRVRDSDNRSGYKGVSWDIRFKRWVARVTKDGKVYQKVGFDSAEDAFDFVCLLREVVHGEFANHGMRA